MPGPPPAATRHQPVGGQAWPHGAGYRGPEAGDSMPMYGLVQAPEKSGNGCTVLRSAAGRADRRREVLSPGGRHCQGQGQEKIALPVHCYGFRVELANAPYVAAKSERQKWSIILPAPKFERAFVGGASVAKIWHPV